MFIVIDVGCIECGEGSGIVGIYVDRAEAEGVAEILNKYYDFTGGQHIYNVYELPEEGGTLPEYQEMINKIAINKVLNT